MSSGKAAPVSIQWISGDDVSRVLIWDDLIKEVRESLAAFSRGPEDSQGAILPLRSRISLEEEKGIMMVMPGLVKSRGALATKILTLFPNNSSKGLPSHHAIIVLMDTHTGIPNAILDGEVITEMRTAAASVVATMELVQKKNDLVIAVLGAGHQGRSHARVMAHVYKSCQIRVWSRREESSKSLVATLVSEGINAEVASSVQEAVKDVDIINTCTMATTPILKAEWVKPGAHINSVGAPNPDWQELDEDLVRQATVYADSKSAALQEAGDIVKSGASIFAEIGEVILGTRPVVKNNTTIFKSLGLAVEDAVSARLAYTLMQEEQR